jgi:hypothetical protein
MTNSTLLLGALFSSVEAIIFFVVGGRLRRRRIPTSDARLAWSLFVVWWYGIALSTLVDGVQSLLGAFGAGGNLPLFLTLAQLNILFICISLFGLLYYLIFLIVGSSRPLIPLVVFYVAYYALLAYYLNSLNPTGVLTGRWTMTLQYEHAAVGLFFTVVLVFLVFPQMLGSLAYFSIFFRVRDVTQKYRILLVSCSIFLWFGSALFGSAAGLGTLDWWQIVSRVIGLVASLMILMAYQPFRWIRRRFGIGSLSEETVKPADAKEHP